MNGLELEELRTGQGGFSVGPVSLAIPAGTATVLLGPSGAGKTTLLRAIAGFLPLQHGEVLVDGRPVGAAPPEARRFGFVPVGVRKGYYQRTGEDAYVMWARDLDSEESARRMAAIAGRLRSRP